jgi:hypothetical protein
MATPQQQIEWYHRNKRTDTAKRNIIHCLEEAQRLIIRERIALENEIAIPGQHLHRTNSIEAERQLFTITLGAIMNRLRK